MKYILDTNAALWLFEGNEKLSQTAQSIIYDDKNEIYISILSAWEVAIKVSLSKMDFDGGSELFLSASEENNIDLLGVKGEHVIIVGSLPYIHRDPFDRLLISTALFEKMTIITSDENIRKYDISWIW